MAGDAFAPKAFLAEEDSFDPKAFLADDAPVVRDGNGVEIAPEPIDDAEALQENTERITGEAQQKWDHENLKLADGLKRSFEKSGTEQQVINQLAEHFDINPQAAELWKHDLTVAWEASKRDPVKFRNESPELARMLLEEMVMEKFGGDQGTDSEKLEKAASEGCPDCGGKVVRHGNVMKCGNCGTKPFEKEKNKT